MLQDVSLMRSAEEFLSHPDFDKARSVYIEAMLGLHENQQVLNRLLFDEGRAFVFMTLITAYAGYVEHDRNTWPTTDLLKRELTALGIASKGRIYDILKRLSDLGYVEAAVAPGDRRAKILMPSQKMLDHDKQALRVYYAPLQALFPQPGYPEPLMGDEPFQKIARQIGFSFVAHSRQFIMANPTIAFFLPRQGGMMVLTKLMKLCLHQPDGRVPAISLAGLGKIFGLSRTHVRVLLHDAESHGFLTMHGKTVSLTEQCRAGFDRFLADTMAGNDVIYRMAKQRLASAA